MQIVPVNEPLIGEKELEYVSEAVRSGWISSEGKYIRAFEDKFSSYVNRKHGITVNNGTNALVLALRVLDLPEKSEVIIPSFTIISCALACVYNNLVPVFVDSEEDTWNMDAAKIQKKITKKTKAIMPVHIYGHPCDMDPISKIARKNKLVVIEDFAEAIGSKYKGSKCGGFGQISCASFYANKVVTTGEGGMCLTDDQDLAERLRKLKNLGFVPGKRFFHEELGFNFRMTNVQAAIGLAQLESIEARVRKKIWIGKTYTKLLKPLEDQGVIRLPIRKGWARNTYWMYGVVLNEKKGLKAAEAMKKLEEAGIQTRPFFCPMHLQPAFKKFSWFKKEKMPVSEKLYEYGFYLPSGLALTEKQLCRVCESLNTTLAI
ncbi:MAG: DegT/DnrJ/EryC1/StrS family aminotransferase [bacterium]|nr:DegT/DnrJ/EryC1/StrS family aminotransferase [bacterium]